MRIQGLREDGPNTLQDKILTLFNGDLKFQPPVMLEEFEVTHRLPRSQAAAAQEPAQASTHNGRADGDSDVMNEPTPAADATSHQTSSRPQTVILKFLSRRTKSRVMDKDVKKKAQRS